MPLRYSLLTVFSLMLLSLPAFAAETRVYELQYHQGQEFEGLVRSLLGEQARVAALHNTLVVIAEPAELQSIDELLRRLDQPAEMLRITVAQGRDQAESLQQQAVRGRIEEGPIIITTGRPGRPDRGGLDIGLGAGDDHLGLHAQQSELRQSRHVEQYLAVMAGEAGRISVGQVRPVTERFLVLARRHAELVETVAYQRIETGFYVRPQRYGDVVELDIQPFMAYLADGRPGEVVFQELSTRVRTPLGRWFDLGGHMAEHDELSREIVARGQSAGTTESSVRIRVDPQ